MKTAIGYTKYYDIRLPVPQRKHIYATLPYEYFEIFMRANNVTPDILVTDYELECEYGPALEDGIRYKIVKKQR